MVAVSLKKKVPAELKFEARRPGPFVEPVFEKAPLVVELEPAGEEPAVAAEEVVEVAAAAIEFPAPPKEEPIPLNDLEMPAVLRRNRQMFQ